MPAVKKVTRSPAGRVEALLLNQHKQKQSHWMTSPAAVESPAFAEMTSEAKE
jgi:hypothetical protein